MAMSYDKLMTKPKSTKSGPRKGKMPPMKPTEGLREALLARRMKRKGSKVADNC